MKDLVLGVLQGKKAVHAWTKIGNEFISACKIRSKRVITPLESTDVPTCKNCFGLLWNPRNLKRQGVTFSANIK